MVRSGLLVAPNGPEITPREKRLGGEQGRRCSALRSLAPARSAIIWPMPRAAAAGQVTLTDIDPAALDARPGQHLSRPLRHMGRGDRAEDSPATRWATRPTSSSSAPRPTATSNSPMPCSMPSRPRALIIEKPLCGPDLAGCAALLGPGAARKASLPASATTTRSAATRSLAEEIAALRRDRAGRHHFGAHPRTLGRHLQGASLAFGPGRFLSRLLAARRRCGRRAFAWRSTSGSISPMYSAPARSPRSRRPWTSSKDGRHRI